MKSWKKEVHKLKETDTLAENFKDKKEKGILKREKTKTNIHLFISDCILSVTLATGR